MLVIPRRVTTVQSRSTKLSRAPHLDAADFSAQISEFLISFPLQLKEVQYVAMTEGREEARKNARKEEWRLLQPSSREKIARELRTYISMGNVVCSMEADESILLGPLLVYVVNFSTKDLHPDTFSYPVCMKSMEDGKRCGKSLQFGPECDHDSFAKGSFTYAYRFEVALSDAVHNNQSKPLRCKISQAASVLLDVSAKKFREWTEQVQYEFVRDLILQMPLCEVYLRVNEGEATVHILNWSSPVLNRPLSPYLPENASRYMPSLVGTSGDGRSDDRTHEIGALEDKDDRPGETQLNRDSRSSVVPNLVGTSQHGRSDRDLSTHEIGNVEDKDDGPGETQLNRDNSSSVVPILGGTSQDHGRYVTKEWRLPQLESREMRALETRSYKSMRDVVLGMKLKHTTMLGPILAYVVNFSTEDLHPHTFSHPLCSICGPNAFAKSCCTHMYRFDVALCDALDGSGQSMPIRCKILEAASVLLGVAATTFREWTEEKQDRYVRELILHMPLCEVHIRVYKGEATVDQLNWSFPALNRPLSPYLPGTERRYLPILVATSTDGRPDGRTHEIEAIEDDRPATSGPDAEGAVPLLIKAFSKWAKRRLRRLQN